MPPSDADKRSPTAKSLQTEPRKSATHVYHRKLILMLGCLLVLSVCVHLAVMVLVSV